VGGNNKKHTTKIFKQKKDKQPKKINKKTFILLFEQKENNEIKKIKK